MTQKRQAIESRLNERLMRRMEKDPTLWGQYCSEQAARQMTFPQLVAACLAGARGRRHCLVSLSGWNPTSPQAASRVDPDRIWGNAALHGARCLRYQQADD